MIHYFCGICKKIKFGSRNDSKNETTYDCNYICNACHHVEQELHPTPYRNSPNFQYLEGIHPDVEKLCPPPDKTTKHYAKIGDIKLFKDIDYHRRKGTYGSFKPFYDSATGERRGIKKAKGWSNVIELRREKKTLEHLFGGRKDLEPSYLEIPYRSKDKRSFYYCAYLVMPYCQGKRLDDHIFQYKKQGHSSHTFDEHFIETCKIMYLLGLIVEGLHKKGVSHNDVKEPNVIIYKSNDNQYEISLIDYGLASYIGEPRDLKFSANQNIYKITPPEFFEEIKPDECFTSRHDSYSMGTMFLRLLYMFFDPSDKDIYLHDPDIILQYLLQKNDFQTIDRRNLLENIASLCNHVSNIRMDISVFNGILLSNLRNSLGTTVIQQTGIPLGYRITYQTTQNQTPSPLTASQGTTPLILTPSTLSLTSSQGTTILTPSSTSSQGITPLIASQVIIPSAPQETAPEILKTPENPTENTHLLLTQIQKRRRLNLFQCCDPRHSKKYRP